MRRKRCARERCGDHPRQDLTDPWHGYPSVAAGFCAGHHDLLPILAKKGLTCSLPYSPGLQFDWFAPTPVNANCVTRVAWPAKEVGGGRWIGCFERYSKTWSGSGILGSR